MKAMTKESLGQSPAQAGNVQSKDQLVLPNSFVEGSTETIEPFHDTSTQMQSGTAVRVGPVDVVSSGFLRGIWLQVDATGAVDATPNAAGHEDSPFNVLQDLQLTDVNGESILGPFDGYKAARIQKWGGYQFNTDPAVSPYYSAVSTNGNFAFLLWLPVEITPHDALGALANMNAASTYKLSYRVAASSTVYTTVPDTTLPSVRVRAWVESWAQPPATDLFGVPNEPVPPANGTTQKWTESIHNVVAGEQTIRLTRVGNWIRNLVLIYKTGGTPARDTTNFPADLRLEYDSQIVEHIGREVFRHRMASRGGLGLDTGVFVFSFCHGDGSGKIGNESRRLWLPTTQATKLQLRGTFGAAGTLSVLTNDVITKGDVTDPRG